LKINENPRSKY